MNTLFRWSLAALLASGAMAAKFADAIPLPSSQCTEDREIVRRKGNLLLAQKLIHQAERAMREKNTQEAYSLYLQALSCASEAPATNSLRRKIRDKFSIAGLRYAHWLIQNGRYSEAKEIAETLLSYHPKYLPATRLLSHLQKPDYFNKTITPALAADQQKIAHLLKEAEGFSSTGRFDLAQKSYEQILNIDPYHTQARQGEKLLHEKKTKYYQEAFEQSRAHFLSESTKRWERPVAADVQSELADASRNFPTRSVEDIRSKLNRIVLPKVEFREATVREVIDFLKQRARELDTASEGKGINIVLKLESERFPPSLPPAFSGNTENSQEGPARPRLLNPKIDLHLANIPLYDALNYVCELAGLKLKIEPYAVSIVPLLNSEEQLQTKEYRISPSFLPTKPIDSERAFGLDPPEEKKKTWVRMRAQEYLQSQGVPFPKGASANYVPAGSRLIIRNTPDAIHLIDSLVAAAHGAPPLQVQIESKFVSISQNNLKELGFDWLLGPLVLSQSGLAFSGGGVALTEAAHYPITNPKSGLPVGTNPVTSNLRRGGNLGSSRHFLSSLLAQNGDLFSNSTPSLFGISGIFTRPQFQMVIRALSQRKGVDLVSAPKITTRSGEKATIKMVRAFPYPTEFQPPQIPQKGIVASHDVLPNNAFVSQIVTPTTPTRFEVRNTGVTLEVEPIVGPDGYTIDLNLSPEIVEFEGFVNYGVPILGVVHQAVTGIPASTILTENNIHQPIFSTRKVTTSVSIADGQTVVLGGFIREDIQKVADKVPLLGDIPGLGYLFRSHLEQKIKENLIIFVTARLIDSQGRSIRGRGPRKNEDPG